MTTIQTPQLGEIRYDESDVWSFPAGIPAFENETRFLLAESARYAPLVFLHSLNASGPRFICAPASALDPTFEYSLGEEDSELLGVESGSPALLCLAILTFPSEDEPTANLRSPIILNPARHIGVQSVQTSGRSCHLRIPGRVGGEPQEGPPPCL